MPGHFYGLAASLYKSRDAPSRQPKSSTVSLMRYSSDLVTKFRKTPRQPFTGRLPLSNRMRFLLPICLFVPFLIPVLALPANSDPSPVIKDRATPSPTVVMSPSNTVIGSISGSVESFNGIFFADEPTGSLRLRPPQKLSTDLGDSFDASGLAGACPQMLVATDNDENLFLQVAGFLLDSAPFQKVTGISENCLTVSVARPAGTTAGAGLPVLFWIYGGAFEVRLSRYLSQSTFMQSTDYQRQLGWTSSYNPTSFLSQAIDQDQPFVFVAVNYRVAGFGFMPGKEILADGSANLGLLDQRMGLEWVADNIAAFGGDPTKVTIWGESAGAISVFDQMAMYGGDITYNGQALFRGAIMDSGSIVSGVKFPICWLPVGVPSTHS